MDENKNIELTKIQTFYNSVYYKDAKPHNRTPRHLRNLAKRIGISKGSMVLDIACGVGEWLNTCAKAGASPHGIDLSEKAISVCKEVLPDGEFYAIPAEKLPFDDGIFDVVTCLGSLEHFVEPVIALKEMVRVAKNDATFILLVPNQDFLTRKLGLYGGTYQVDAKEEVRTLEEWQALFEQAGIEITQRWKDLHVISWHWITQDGLARAPLRAAQAFALALWPLRWQYQVYHQCNIKK